MHAMVTPAILAGHRRILEVLREFRFTEPGGGEPDTSTMRGLIAFLRQEILPFASREEAGLPPDSEEREATAFEHAFLAAEIDALDGACRMLADGGAEGAAERLLREAEVRRRIHRIEAVLELHAGRQAERWVDACDAGDASPGRPAGARRLERPEVDAILRRSSWGLLSTAGEEGPYAVPVAYGYDGACFYIASGGGRKVRNLESNPAACLTVLEVGEAGRRWRSVVVTGRIEWVSGIRDSFTALGALRRQWSGLSPVSLRDAVRLRGARLFRIVPAEITGRAREE